MKTLSRPLLAGLLVVAVLLAGAAWAGAEVITPHTIYACVTSTGTVRLVANDTSCKKNETLETWKNAAAVDVLQAQVDSLQTQVTQLQLKMAAFSRKFVFVTEDTLQGNFGTLATGDHRGLTAADATCQAAAASANLPGAYKAWLSETQGLSASDRLTHSAFPYVRVDGVKIADNWTDLTDGDNLDASISVTEHGTVITAQTENRVWTNTTTAGAYGWLDCEHWLVTGAYLASTGLALNVDSQWTHDPSMYACGERLRLYCFEQ